MDAIILAASTFMPEIPRKALDWDLCRDSLESEKSTVSIMGADIPQSRNGDWLLIDDSLYRIANVAPSDGKTKLQLLPPEDAFDRPRFYTVPPADSSIGDFIVRELLDGWRDEPDTVYAMPYLHVSSLDTTPFIPPELDSSGRYVLADYIRMVRRLCNVRSVFSIADDHLAVTVRKFSPGEAVVIPEDGHTKLKTASFSATTTAKITTIQPVDTGETDPETGEKIFERSVQTWYLSADGQISHEPPANRATGVWAQLILSEKADPAESVAAQFDKNSEAHKLEFWYDGELHVLDRFTILLDSGSVADTVESIWSKRGESRRLYKSGQQAKSLTEKVRGSSGSSGGRSGKTSGAAAQEIPVGSLFLTVQEGNPAELLGYGAWTLLQDVALVGAGNKWTAGTVIGSDSHTLTADELPELEIPLKNGNYGVGAQQASAGSGSNWTLLRAGITGASVTIPGEGKAFSTVQRSFALYIWLRKE